MSSEERSVSPETLISCEFECRVPAQLVSGPVRLVGPLQLMIVILPDELGSPPGCGIGLAIGRKVSPHPTSKINTAPKTTSALKRTVLEKKFIGNCHNSRDFRNLCRNAFTL